MDLVQFIENRHLRPAEARQGRLFRERLRRPARQRRGGLARYAHLGGRRRPDIAGPIDGTDADFHVGAGFQPQIAQVHMDAFSGLAGQRDEIARHLLTVHGHEETRRSSGPLVRRRRPGNPRFSGRQVLDLRTQLRRSKRRLLIRRSQEDRQIRGRRRSGFTAVDEAIGEETEGKLLAVAGPLGAGVIEEKEAVTDAGDAGGDDGGVHGDAAASRARPAEKRRPFATASRPRRASRCTDRCPARSTARSDGGDAGGLSCPVGGHSWAMCPRPTRRRNC